MSWVLGCCGLSHASPFGADVLLPAHTELVPQLTQLLTELLLASRLTESMMRLRVTLRVAHNRVGRPWQLP